jgi:hypothetical protein
MALPHSSTRPSAAVEPIHYRGVPLDRRRCRRIQRIIDQQPTLTRVALDQRVCTMFGWWRFNGELPERSCRSLLDRLHQRGWIELPPSRRPRPAGPRVTRHVLIPTIFGLELREDFQNGLTRRG